jgi:uncharacterized protein (UPF0548 family)
VKRTLPLRRRLRTAIRWPFGIVVTSWAYMWRTTPISRGETVGCSMSDSGPQLPTTTKSEGLQLADVGTGPLFHRLYRIRIKGTRVGPKELLSRIASNPNRAAPRAFATFEKIRGPEGGMRVGDEYIVRIPGPWDGPVRVIKLTDSSFRLVTLEGHLEAGQIEFRARQENRLLVFEIESWARSGDRLSGLLYNRLRLAKEIQLHMWTSFLEHAAETAGGRRQGRLEIKTRRVDTPAEPFLRALRDPRTLRLLDELHERAPNYHLPAGAEPSRADGWEIDEYRRPLPPEQPGPPVADGPWELGRQVLLHYEFADPGIVTAVYKEDVPLAERTMLLELRFHGLRFHAGVRVSAVRDEEVETGGQTARVWGWSYRTLQGHLEMGQMDYELWKWLESGAVEFRIRRYARAARIPNPVVRLGFRLFGRREQIRFAENALERLSCLVEARLAHPNVAAVGAGRSSPRQNEDESRRPSRTP